MKTLFKRIFSLLMVLTILGSMLPAVYAATPNSETVTLTDEDYIIVDDVFAQINAMEDAPAKKAATQTQLTDAAAQIVMASQNYVEGSLERNGNSFTWWTDEGIRCIYNPYMREKYKNMEAPANPLPSGIYNEPKATRGGWPSGNQVYLIAPYYGLDDSFTDQYKNEAASIASAIGDTDGYTLYSGTAVTVDKVADAIENGAVVIFDSHGTTDYDGSYVCDEPDGYEVYDYVTRANYSYLCLTNKTGLTTADYNAGASYFTDSYGDPCACINGAAIANHMDKNSPGGILWMAICLGMATNTICEPMRSKGVEVVYGYSQSVTFSGDYLFEETFWDNMIAGKDVATSISAMKSKWGKWDWSEQIANAYGYYGSGYSLYEARRYRYAFPIVVSDEDAHPGQRNGDSFYGADSVQTVNSTYTLFAQHEVTAQSSNESHGSVSVNGNTITAVPAEGYYAESATVISGNATVSQNGNTFSVNAQSDCTVQINFAVKTPVTVYFNDAGSLFIQHGYAGNVMSLPTQTAPEGYTFLGWTSSALSEDTTEKPNYYTDSFIPTADTELCALYSYVNKEESSGSGDYVRVNSTPADWSGEYLIVYEYDDLILDGSLSTLDAKGNVKSVNIYDETISAAQGDPYKFTVEAVDGGYTIKSASGKYIGGKSGMNTLTSSSTPITNSLSLDWYGDVDVVSNTSYLRYNDTDNRFRYYKSSSYDYQQPIALYVKEGAVGTTYYTTTIPDCPAHFTLSGLDAVVTPPSCTSGGYTTYSCPTCGFSCTSDATPATGHSYVGGVCTACGDQQMAITSQPSSKITEDGYNAAFKVKATGTGLKYQWQYRTSSSGSWQNAKASGNQTNTLSVPASVSRHGYQYRCRITDAYGNRVYSKTVTLYVLGIKTQPVSKTVVADKTAKLTVAATGHKLTYQWQYRTSSGGSWKNAKADGSKTKTLSIPASVSRHGYQYRCKITDSKGNTVYTNIVSLYVLGIKTQPVSKTVKPGATAKFTVAATGKGLTFQWQYRTSSKDSWKNAKADGSKTKTLSVPGTTSRNGYQYRCKITDSAGNVIYTKIIKLTVKK